MKRNEFNNLKIGDICVIKRGLEAARKVIIRYIESEQIVIAALDGKRLKTSTGYTMLKVTGWHELDVSR